MTAFPSVCRRHTHCSSAKKDNEGRSPCTSSKSTLALSEWAIFSSEHRWHRVETSHKKQRARRCGSGFSL